MPEPFRRFLIAIIAAGAVLQWAVVLERTWAAVWAWYKFSGFGGGGHIIVGRTTQIVFLLGSVVIAALGHGLFKVEAGAGDSGALERCRSVRLVVDHHLCSLLDCPSS